MEIIPTARSDCDGPEARIRKEDCRVVAVVFLAVVHVSGKMIRSDI
jgi:hypothetical protein